MTRVLSPPGAFPPLRRTQAAVVLLRLGALISALVLLAAAPTGGLYVTSLPPAADVWVDGTYVGHSPVLVDALAAGKHTVGLSRTGWGSQELDVTVVAGQTSVASVPLERAAGARPAGGTLRIHAAGVRSAELDGARIDASKEIGASSGVHRLVVVTPQGKATREVTVYPDVRTDVVVREEEAARSVVVAPANDYLDPADVRVEGARVVLRHGGHEAAGRLGSTAYRLDGRAATFDTAPTIINGRLYLPIELLQALTAGDKPR